MIFIGIVCTVAGACVGFMAAAFVAGQSTPCRWCDERDRQAAYKFESYREALGQ